MNAQEQELNIRVATEVLGYSWMAFPAVPNLQRPGPNGVEVLFELPNYCGDIAAAWSVVEELIRRGLEFDIEYKVGEGWCPIFYTSDMDICAFPNHNASAPLAICHAALDICARLRGGDA